MLSDNMLNKKIKFICFIVFAIGITHGLPLQNLPNLPGYISVYIRHDNQPLIEINPNLAEAFQEKVNYFQQGNLGVTQE
ncbi:uncharacterized protein LOC127286964 isoform X2 [Leptopilina boulardi]|uniref:uncharacterized protein LOC127286964 isoform X2 n=1 Tax=Leptopilina boulardi TaxID=63433 RepID=UPI0021F54EE6|nr:uncharacterized protein LOC127286964 isoform X2 [Leptopilina boulardi]